MLLSVPVAIGTDSKMLTHDNCRHELVALRGELLSEIRSLRVEMRVFALAITMACATCTELPARQSVCFRGSFSPPGLLAP